MDSIQQEIFDNYFGSRKKPTAPMEIVEQPTSIIDLQSLQPNEKGQRAEGNTDIYGFAVKLGELLATAWQDENVTFTINGVKDENIEELDMPMIVFDVIERVPSRVKPGIKSRAMELQIDPEDDNYSIIVHRKWFDAMVEFLVLDTTNQDAIKLADRFELFIDTFTGFFKEAGVSELIFSKEVDSRLSKNYIEHVPSRCLRYQMVVERIVIERVRTTKEVRSKIQATSLNRG